MFLCLDSGRTLAVYEKVRELLNFIKKKILICFPKMNEGITGLEWPDGEYDHIFIFGWTIPLNYYFCKRYTIHIYFLEFFVVWDFLRLN